MSLGGYSSVVLDVDSTLCGIEGIDWLAARRGPQAGRRIAELTDRAMNGDLALDAVYGERLGAVRPSRGDLEALASAYEELGSRLGRAPQRTEVTFLLVAAAAAALAAAVCLARLWAPALP